jgi:hypothetical protein
MAPEQLEGKEADARSDIFAFGSVVYEMATGRAAFEGKSQASLIAAILDREPPPISTIRPLTPMHLDHVVMRCLAKNPEDRWQSASDLLMELRWTSEVALTDAKPSSSQETRPEQSGPHLLKIGVVALIAAIAVVIGGAAMWLLKPETPNVSDSGTLAYVAGSPQLYERRLVWVDRGGKVEALPVPVGDYLDPDISTDGRFIAVQILGQTHTISIFDRVRGTLTPLDTPAGSSNPGRWTLDGKKIIYRASRAGTRNLFWKAWNGSGDEERLTTGSPQTPSSISSDGKQLAFTEDNVATGLDIWLLRLDGKSKPELFLRTPAAEYAPQIEPHSRWIAYQSNASGSMQIYVRPLAGGGGQVQISTSGGAAPLWSRDGRELFYINGNRMMVVDVIGTTAFSAPRQLFEDAFVESTNQVTGYDIAADGRFLRVQQAEPEQPLTEIQLVFDWFAELKERMR